MQPTALWNDIHDIQSWKLEVLELSGWVMCNEGIKKLLRRQLPTLIVLQFSDCAIENKWAPVLDQLADAPVLMQVSFCQVSGLRERVVWSSVGSGPLEDEEENDWVVVYYVGARGILLWSNGGGVGEIVAQTKQRMFSIDRIADPRAYDAQAWAPHYDIRLRERLPYGVPPGYLILQREDRCETRRLVRDFGGAWHGRRPRRPRFISGSASSTQCGIP